VKKEKQKEEKEEGKSGKDIPPHPPPIQFCLNYIIKQFWENLLPLGG